MGTITGLTAEAMQELVDGQIMGASIIANHLILERNDGSTLDAGDVGVGSQVAAHEADKLAVHGIDDTDKLPRMASQEASVLKIIRGRVNANGTLALGTGFTPSKPGTGDYLISFTTPFSSTPVVLCGLFNQGSGGMVIAPQSTGNSSTVVRGRSSGGSLTDMEFGFIAIGAA